MNEPIDSRKQLLWDVFVTACEGGINYWATLQLYHHSNGETEDHDTFEARIIDTEADKRYQIHHSTIEKGIKLLCSGKVRLREDLKKAVLIANAENDAAYLDADSADCIVQAGLFEDVLYG